MKWLLTAAAVLSAAAVACAEPPAVESDPAAYVLWVAQNIFRLGKELSPTVNLDQLDGSGLLGRGEFRPVRPGHGPARPNRPTFGEVFGAAGRPGAKTIVYVVDRSARMDEVGDFVKTEILKAANKLNDAQSVNIIWYGEKNSGRPVALSPTLLPATEENKAKLLKNLGEVDFRGEAEPRVALLQALELKADVLYLLTDVSIDPKLVEEVAKKNVGKTQIQVVWFAERRGKPDAALQKLADDNKGSVKVVDRKELFGN